MRNSGACSISRIPLDIGTRPYRYRGPFLSRVGQSSGLIDVTATEDVSQLSTENLARYAAVMFYTTGELSMSAAQKAALLDFVRSGRGFIGVHSATDTFYEWADYGALIGGYFDGHPWHQSVRINVSEPSDALVAFLGPSFEIKDEIYQIRDFDEQGSRVLLRLDGKSVDLSREGVHQRSYGWPLAWRRSYGRGRVFYTALGHEQAVWRDPRYQRLLLNAIRWSIKQGDSNTASLLGALANVESRTTSKIGFSGALI